MSTSLRVTLDPAYRVVGVEVLRPDDVRTPERLSEAFTAAYRAAVVDETRTVAPTASASTQRAGQRPAAVATLASYVPPSAELLQRHRIRTESAGLPRRRHPGAVVGRSRNECVTVELPPAATRGVLDVDAGWLAQASASHIGDAVTEAYQHAYSERDQ